MNNLKEIRLQKKLTQQELCEKSGISRPMISNIEKGNRIGTKDVWTKLAAALDVEVNDLIDLRKPPNFDEVGKEVSKLLVKLEKSNIIKDIDNIDDTTVSLILTTIQTAMKAVKNKTE